MKNTFPKRRGAAAAIVARRARDAGLPLALHLLVYPVTDAACDTESYATCSTGYGLTRDSMLWFWNQYLPEGDRLQPEASPLRADDLAGVAPAFVLTAEYDPLRDEAEAYARKLEAAGVPVTLRRYEGQIHGFFRMTGVTGDARAALVESASAFRAAFAAPVPT